MQKHDNRLIDQIIVQSIDDGFWHREVQFDELKTVKTDHDVKSAHDDHAKVVVHEGSFDRWVDTRALNLVTMLLWDRGYVFDLLQEFSPNHGRGLIDRHISVELIDAPDPQLRDKHFDIARTKTFVQHACNLAAFLVGDDREDNYTYRLYRGLAISEVKLNLGTNPRNHTKEFYSWEGPVRVVVPRQDKISEGVVNGKSAAEADW